MAATRLIRCSSNCEKYRASKVSKSKISVTTSNLSIACWFASRKKSSLSASPTSNQAKRTAPKLAPSELKRWLDEGRPVTLLDTRNDYEVKLGTFKNAVTLGIDHFRSFPTAIRQLPAELKQQPIVMFCTGGIRCEKAGPYMEREGFEQVFQLDGGILKYFEDCGGEHYAGECFVFDKRVGVDSGLAESENTQCFNCLTPLTQADQEDDRYVPGKSCRYCFKTTEEQAALNLAAAREDSPGHNTAARQCRLRQFSADHRSRRMRRQDCHRFSHDNS